MTDPAMTRGGPVVHWATVAHQLLHNLRPEGTPMPDPAKVLAHYDAEDARRAAQAAKEDSADRVRAWLDERVPAVTTFVLRRLVDTTGISGTGVVADGAVFPDLRAVTRWRGGTTGVAQTCVWDNLHHIRRVHGHHGETRIEFIPYDVLANMVRAALDAAQDRGNVIAAVADVLAAHEEHEAEIDRAARGVTA